MKNGELRDRIDSLFTDFDKPETPGCAVGVMVEGKLIYSRGYGIANLEYDIPVTEKTAFHLASMAKQFTAMSIALLEEQGLVNLDDEIHRFFPELPQYPWPVTVGHLVYMTNGLFDIYGLANFVAGIHENDFFTQDQAWEMIKACDWLMFKPGEKFSYGNTGYFLLGQLVERVTGQSLSEFAEKNIFAPLGMSNTFFRDDRTRIIKNRAESYSDYEHLHYNTQVKPWSSRGNKLLINGDQMELPGAGQVWSTVEDLFLWDQNFYTNKLGKGSMELIKKVTTPGKLNDCSTGPYAYGLFAQSKDGYDYVCHGGWANGWSSFMHRIPEKHCTVVCLANHTNSFLPLEVYGQSYSIPEQIMEMVLDDFKVIKPESQENVSLDTQADFQWSQIVGRYQDPKDSWLLKIEIRDGKCVADLDYGRVLDLNPVDATTFQTVNQKETFTLEDEEQGLLLMLDGDKERVFHRFLDSLSSDKLEEYVGEYQCEKLGINFVVSVEGGKLKTLNTNRRHTAVDFCWAPTITDTFLAEYPPYCPTYCISFNRNPSGEVTSMVFRDEEGSKRENLLFSKITIIK